MTQMQTPPNLDQDEQLQFSTFYLDETFCGINIEQVQEINEELSITRVPLSPDYVMGIMNLRGQIVTIINLSMKIGLTPSVVGPKSRVVITNSKGEFIGLLVDRVAEVVTTSRKLIAKPPANIEGVQGKFFEGILHSRGQELMALLNVAVVLEDGS